MKRRFEFGDHVRFKDEENPVFGVILEEANIYDQVTVQFICDEEAAVVYANDLEFIPHPDSARLDWMILREHADDLCTEDKAFVLQTYRENIDTFIRLAAEQGATA